MTTKPDEKAQPAEPKAPEHKPEDQVHLALLTDAGHVSNLNLGLNLGLKGLTTAEKPASAAKAEPAKTDLEKREPARVNSQAMVRESKNQPTLTDEQMNEILYRGLSSAKSLLTTTKDDLMRGNETRLIDEEKCRALKEEGKQDSQGVCTDTVNNSGGFALNFIKKQETLRAPLNDRTQTVEAGTEVTQTDVNNARSAQASFDWAISTAQKYRLQEGEKANDVPGLERLPNGGYIRRDANGHEIYRKEGDLSTVTAPDGRTYRYNNKTHETTVVDKAGKEILRKHADGSIDFLHGDGSFTRKKGQFIENHGADGKLASVVEQRADGTVRSLLLGDYIKVQVERTNVFQKMGAEAISAAFGTFDNTLAAHRQGVTLAQDATITTDKNGQTLIRSTDGKGAYVFLDKNTAIFRDGLGNMAIVMRNGQKIDVPPEKAAELSKKYGAAMQAMMEAGRGIQNILTARGVVTVENKANGETTVTGPNGEHAQKTALGEFHTLDAAGNKTDIRPNGTATITNPDGKKLEIKPGSLNYEGLDVDPAGKITDRENGTVIDDKGIRSADGTELDFASGRARFADGVELGAGGEVLSHGSSKNGAVAQAEASAREAEANSMAAKAESIASSIAGKAASGRLTAADVAMLQAALGGLERSLKMLDNETDMTSLVRLMMSKGSVEESLGKVESGPKVA